MAERRTVNADVPGSSPGGAASWQLLQESGIIMIMTQEIAVEEEVKQYVLSPLNRCDSCAAEALVLIKGVTGELMFCGHHYKKNETALADFAYEIIDERDKLIENKAKSKDY